MLVEHFLKFHSTILKFVIALINVVLKCDGKPVDPNLVTEDFSTKEISIPAEDAYRNDTIQKKIYIIVFILCLCVVCAIILSFVNIHDDFVELKNFYRGYMGRRLLIQEKRLVYRSQTNVGGQINQKKVAETDSARCGKYPTQNGGVHFIKLEEELSPVTTTSSFCSWPDEMADTFLSTEAPLARRFVEDEAREWRELDYTLEVGKPPDTFCSFIRQYDWNIFTLDGLSSKEIQDRKNLLNQFRQWKKRKRKSFNIFVTERARRDMAEAEEKKNEKRMPHSK